MEAWVHGCHAPWRAGGAGKASGAGGHQALEAWRHWGPWCQHGAMEACAGALLLFGSCGHRVRDHGAMGPEAVKYGDIEPWGAEQAERAMGPGATKWGWPS